ncbi:MAG: TonB-dependent receptor [Spirosomataceae bacterium]
MKYCFLALFFLLSLSETLFAQKATDILIKDEFYNNQPLNRVYDDLQQKYNFKMVYDAELLKKYRLTYWFVNIKMEAAIKTSLKELDAHDLKYYLDNDEVFHIVLKTEKVDPNQVSVMQRGGKISISKQDAKALMPPPAASGMGDVKVKKNQPAVAQTAPAPKAEAPKKINKNPAPTKFNFTLSGRIIDNKSSETLPFATIFVKSKKTVIAQTNVDGYFTLLNVPSDTVTLQISYIGYKPTLFYLYPELPTTGLNFELEASNQELEEVVVLAEKNEVMKANETIGMFKMTPRNIRTLPNVGERDVFRAFQLMPGVSAANESSAGLYVRGGTPDQTLVLYDGFTVYYVDHLYGFFSAFNYNAIKDVQLFKGGFDSKFGGRLSGVAEITGKEGNKRELNAGGDVSLLSANAFVEGPIGDKFTVMFAGRRSWKGPLYNKIFSKLNSGTTQQQGFRPGGGGGGPFGRQQTATTVSSYFFDLNGKVTYRPTEKDVVTLSVYDGADKLDNSQNNGFNFGGASNRSFANTDLSNWGNTGGSLKWSRRWNTKFYSNFLASYSNYFSNRDNTTQFSLSDSRSVKFGSLEDNDLKDYSFKSDLEWKILPNHQLEFGTQLSELRIRYNYSQNDTTSILSKNDNGTLASFYLQDKIRWFNDRLVFTPGFRATYFSVTGKTYYEPRISATYQYDKQLKFKAAVGKYYQFAKQVTREDFSSGNRNFWVLSNGDYLPVSSAKHYIVGASYETKDYLFDVEAYYKDLSNVTEYTLRFTPQIGRGLSVNETFFTGTGYVRGIDFLIQKKFGDYNGWIGYTLAEAKNNIQQFSPQPFYANQDVRHEFKSINAYKWGHWDFALTWIFAKGKPYTSIIGGYSVKLLDGTTKDFTDPSAKNAQRLPDYHRLDVSATYNFAHGSVGFSIFNLYNRSNVWYKKFQVVQDDTTGEKTLLVTDVNYLGITPNITFSYKLR